VRFILWEISSGERKILPEWQKSSNQEFEQDSIYDSFKAHDFEAVAYQLITC